MCVCVCYIKVRLLQVSTEEWTHYCSFDWFCFCSPRSSCCRMVLVLIFISVCFVTGDGQIQNQNVVSVANFAIDFHNHMNNYPYAFKVVNILSDSAQVRHIEQCDVMKTPLIYWLTVFERQIYPPAWVKYTLKVETAQTVCRNQADVNLDDCPLQSDAKVRNHDGHNH